MLFKINMNISLVNPKYLILYFVIVKICFYKNISFEKKIFVLRIIKIRRYHQVLPIFFKQIFNKSEHFKMNAMSICFFNICINSSINSFKSFKRKLIKVD